MTYKHWRIKDLGYGYGAWSEKYFVGVLKPVSLTRFKAILDEEDNA